MKQLNLKIVLFLILIFTHPYLVHSQTFQNCSARYNYYDAETSAIITDAYEPCACGVTVKGEFCSGFVSSTEVNVLRKSDNTLIFSGTTDNNGYIAWFVLPAFTSGYYITKAWHPARPNDSQSGETTFYYDGYCSVYATVCLGAPYTPHH